MGDYFFKARKKGDRDQPREWAIIVSSVERADSRCLEMGDYSKGMRLFFLNTKYGVESNKYTDRKRELLAPICEIYANSFYMKFMISRNECS